VSVKFDTPRQLKYDLYIAVMKRNKVFSEYDHVTIHHPGIKKLAEPDYEVEGSIIILTLPPVYEKNDIYGNVHLEGEEEERDIIGYCIRLVSGGLEKEEKVANVKGQITKHIWVSPGTWELTVGAYDSTVNSKFNSELFEETFSVPINIEVT